jgi:hypothetical protein
MKTLIASSAVVAAMLLGGTSATIAQERGAFCLQGSDSGALNCSYDTLAQCQASMKGASNESCVPNTNRTTGSGAQSKSAPKAGSGTAGAAATGGMEPGGSSGGATSGPNANR